MVEIVLSVILIAIKKLRDCEPRGCFLGVLAFLRIFPLT